jgi:glycyl-tRNA synthetase alpha subunit
MNNGQENNLSNREKAIEWWSYLSENTKQVYRNSKGCMLLDDLTIEEIYNAERLPIPVEVENEDAVLDIAMDSLKSKWEHLYSFGYPTPPFPTNYQHDLDMFLLGYHKAASSDKDAVISELANGIEFLASHLRDCDDYTKEEWENIERTAADLLTKAKALTASPK